MSRINSSRHDFICLYLRRQSLFVDYSILAVYHTLIYPDKVSTLTGIRNPSTMIITPEVHFPDILQLSISQVWVAELLKAWCEDHALRANKRAN